MELPQLSHPLHAETTSNSKTPPLAAVSGHAGPDPTAPKHQPATTARHAPCAVQPDGAGTQAGALLLAEIWSTKHQGQNAEHHHGEGRCATRPDRRVSPKTTAAASTGNSGPPPSNRSPGEMCRPGQHHNSRARVRGTAAAGRHAGFARRRCAAAAMGALEMETSWRRR
jgi:hypothetical protein